MSLLDYVLLGRLLFFVVLILNSRPLVTHLVISRYAPSE
jgi:hypothetical protein